MTVTNALPQDLPRMIELLKSSLGESLVPKSEDYFRWKHEQNPFGASHILLAREDDKIIGLRAFMYWEWVKGRESIKAVRAVDTATDPAHQGKGIFKKLTLQAVEECKQQKVGLVFNSPNPISMAGYLKMGWRQAGKMPILIGPGSLIPRGWSDVKIASILDRYPVENAIAHLHARAFSEPDTYPLHTPLSYEYLHWRYETCPVVRYGAIAEPGVFGYIFRLKKLKQFSELRICEAWTKPGKEGAVKKAHQALRELVRDLRPALVSSAPTPYFDQGQRRPATSFGPLQRGPMVTIRPLHLENLDQFDQFHDWQPSMGSMELF